MARAASFLTPESVDAHAGARREGGVVSTDKEPMTAYLVGLRRDGLGLAAAEEHLDELAALADTYGVPVVGREVAPLREAHAKYLVGEGKAHEIKMAATAAEADIIVFDDDLGPGQQRNWEKLTGMAVIDRREVILGIFADRARTREARLQVDLARAEYSLPRLTRAWTHLERQRAAGGARGGAGESQLEVDRRLVRDQITQLKAELKLVRRVRANQRKARVGVPVPTAALVGYTNAGKSSLLNALSGAGVLAENRLFATLDPTTRRMTLPDRRPLLLSDTVGFIRKLPHDLVAAFKATLEEAQLASFLIHVVDAGHPQAMEQRTATEEVLRELEAIDKPTVLVLNKTDTLPDDGEEAGDTLARLSEGYPHTVAISARTGKGIPQLLAKLEELTPGAPEPMTLRIPADRGDLIALLHSDAVLQQSRHDETDGALLAEAMVPPRLKERFAEFSA